MIEFKFGDKVSLTDTYHNETIETTVSGIDVRQTKSHRLTWIRYNNNSKSQWVPAANDRDNISKDPNIIEIFKLKCGASHLNIKIVNDIQNNSKHIYYSYPDVRDK